MASEQISITRLIEVTVNDFDESLKAWKFALLSAHCGVNSIELAHRLAKNRGLHVFDARRRLTSEEEQKRDYLEKMAEVADEHVRWLKDTNFQPLMRSALVSQCVSFENFIKMLGVAAVLTKFNSQNLNALIFVPSADLDEARGQIDKWWAANTQSRIAEFLSNFVLNCPVLLDEYPGLLRLDLVKWDEIWNDVFRARNVVVHSRGRVGKNAISLGGQTFYPGDELIVTEPILRHVDLALYEVLQAFRISLADL